MKNVFLIGVLSIGMLACGGETESEVVVLGEWEGKWFAEGKGEATATVVRTEAGYRVEIRDADGDTVTWLDGVEKEDGIHFDTTEDSPDRYLSRWRGFIGNDGAEFVGQSYPAREFGGFRMRKRKE